MAHRSLVLAAMLCSAAMDQVAASLLPLVANTWAFTDATDRAWSVLCDRAPAPDAALRAVEEGCSVCEQEQCDFTVGYGGSPDETGRTTLDAVIMDGATMAAGAVAALDGVRQAITAARLVMQHTSHTLLAGRSATEFAVSMGLTPAALNTSDSSQAYANWHQGHCQPNYRRNVAPDPATSCGPYCVASVDGQPTRNIARSSTVSRTNHDTIAMIAIDANGNISAGASSNGASHKVPGRVGDAAVPGGAVYADNDVGACGSTGDGDIHLRLLPCYQVVESMRQGMGPLEAAENAVRRIVRSYPDYVGAVLAVDATGRHAAACHGWTFTYAVRDASMESTQVRTVKALPSRIAAAGASAHGSMQQA